MECFCNRTRRMWQFIPEKNIDVKNGDIGEL